MEARALSESAVPTLALVVLVCVSSSCRQGDMKAVPRRASEDAQSCLTQIAKDVGIDVAAVRKAIDDSFEQGGTAGTAKAAQIRLSSKIASVRCEGLLISVWGQQEDRGAVALELYLNDVESEVRSLAGTALAIGGTWSLDAVDGWIGEHARGATDLEKGRVKSVLRNVVVVLGEQKTLNHLQKAPPLIRAFYYTLFREGYLVSGYDALESFLKAGIGDGSVLKSVTNTTPVLQWFM